MRRFDDSFTWATDAEVIGRRLIEQIPLFGHLQPARLAYVHSQPTVMLRGHPCQALVGQLRVQGPFAGLCDWLVAQWMADHFENDDPEFILLFDAALWSTFDAVKREALVYHELRHIEQKLDENGIPRFNKADGRPLFTLVPHDAEFFLDEVERYGPAVTGQIEATIALASGARRAERGDVRPLDGGTEVPSDPSHVGVPERAVRAHRRQSKADV